MKWLVKISVAIILTHAACAAPLFQIDFENPPHDNEIVTGYPTNRPSDHPSKIEDSVTLVTNIAGMTGQAALVNSFQGYSGISLSTFTSALPPYAVTSSSGVNRLEWKMTVLDWTSHVWPIAEIRSDTSEGAERPVEVYFYYTGGTTGTIRVKGNAVGTFTTNHTYHFRTETDLDEDTINVWLDDVHVLTNRAIASECTMWYVVLTAGPLVGAKVVYDDIVWKQIERPHITRATDQIVEWRCESNYSYRVQAIQSLMSSDWTNVTDSVLATSSTMTALVPTFDDRTHFIRVKADE